MRSSSHTRSSEEGRTIQTRASSRSEPEWFSRLCEDIRSLRIQGAERIARAAVEGVARYMRENGRAPPGLLVDRLLRTRPTEPMMRNAVAYFLANAKEGQEAAALEHVMGRFDSADEAIARYAAGLIKDGSTVLTHCHSSTVTHALIRAHQSGKRFSVHNTETRPRLQGRITAEELASAGIPVTHFVDSAARVALKGCSAVFLGADALLADGKVANKIGSEMVAELAANRSVPVYILACSWKYDRASAHGFKAVLEERSPDEVWREPPAGVKVENPAFEFVMPRYVRAIITEHGILDPHTAAKRLDEEFRRQASLTIRR